MSEEQQEETNESIEVDEDIQKTLDSDAALRKFLGGDKFVNDLLGIELKPVTLASLAIMQEAGCELISGKEIDAMDNVMMEILLFVYIHSEELEVLSEIISKAEDPKKAMKMRALTMGHEIQPDEIPALVNRIVNILSEATSTKVEPLPDEEDTQKKT